MRKCRVLKEGESGFTLIEAIVTIVLIAFVGLMVVTFSGTALTNSVIPLFWERDEFLLKERVEQLTASYVDYINNTADANAVVFKTMYVDPLSAYATSSFIQFNCSGGTCSEIADTTGQNRILRVTVSSQDKKAVVIFSDLKNAGDILYISY